MRKTLRRFGADDDYKGMEREVNASDVVTTPDDRLLVVALARGERSAFKFLYDRHARAVHLYAASIVRDSQLVDEVTQETWLTLWARRSSLALAGESVLTWLFVTARHKSLNRLARARKQSREVELEETVLLPSGVDSAEAVDVAEILAVVEAIVAAMPALDRELYLLCLRDGASYESAAHALGINHGAVRNRLFRIRRALRTAIATNGGWK